MSTAVCVGPKSAPAGLDHPHGSCAVVGACGAPHHPSSHRVRRPKPTPRGACAHDPASLEARLRCRALPPRGALAALRRLPPSTLGALGSQGAPRSGRPDPVAGEARVRGALRRLPPAASRAVGFGSSRTGRGIVTSLRRTTPVCAGCLVRHAWRAAAPKSSDPRRHASRCRARVLTGRTALGRRVPAWPRSGCRAPPPHRGGVAGRQSGRPSVGVSRHLPRSPEGRDPRRRAKCWMVPPSALLAVLPRRSR